MGEKACLVDCLSPILLVHKGLQGRAVMRTIPRCTWVAVALAMGVFLFVQRPAFPKPADERKADRKAISTVLSAQQTAWNHGDVDTFLGGYWHSPELTFSGSSGVARGWDGVLARYKKNYPDRGSMGQLDFSELEFRFLGPEAALVLGRWHLKREKDDVGGVFTLVWRHFPDGWRIIHDHTSVVAPANQNP
jgi:uncharacterized protein (TIGR02246 family)